MLTVNSTPLRRWPLALLLSASLSACGSSGTPPSPTPAAASQHPAPAPQPSKAGLGRLYRLDLSTDQDGQQAQVHVQAMTPGLAAQSTEVQGLAFTPVGSTVSSSLATGRRYLQASFRVSNTGSAAVQVPEYVPLATTGSVATVGNTPFSNVRHFDGSDASGAASSMSLGQATLIGAGSGLPEVNASATPFKTGLDTADLQPTLPGGTQLTRVFDQGWVGQALPAGGQQVVTFGVELPLSSDPRQDPYSFSLLFTVTDAAGTGGAPGALNWSDPASWPGGKVPAAGEQVTLPAGKRMMLDVSPPDLGGLTIPAGSTLEFAEQDLTLKSEWLMVHGTLQIGSEARPFAHQANILLTDHTPNEDVMGMGDRVLGVMDGTLELHGQKPTPWTRLSATAPAGATTLTLEQAPGWHPGDSLTLSSTDFGANQTEQVAVQSVSGTTVSLTAPLKYTHWAASTGYGSQVLNEKAEVGLLTHNVRIGATDDASGSGIGAQTMLMDRSQGRVEGVEFVRVGQRNGLRHYPVHFHLLGRQPNSYFRGNSIHDSYNRCVTIHGTSDLRVQDNVTYNNVGHCIFLEDGNETGNIIDGNLVTLVRAPDSQKGETPLLASDHQAAAYWITNPANTVTNNVAAGTDGFGFWLAFPEHPTGLGAASGADTWNRRTPLGIFRGNVAHSGSRGLNVDDGPNPDGTTSPTHYTPLSNPADPKSAPVPASLTDFTSYKNRDVGAWVRGEHLNLSNFVLADNAVGATLAASDSALDHSLLVGESDNVGQHDSWETGGAGGRSLPRPWEPAFPIRGFQFYDGPVSLQNSALAGFTPNSVRQASGLGALTPNPFAVEPGSFTRNLSWLDGSNRVFLATPRPENDGDRNATFLDQDGSLTGTAGQSVTASPVLRDAPDCAVNAAWNASVCGGTYTRLWLQDVNKGKPGPVTVRSSRGTGMPLLGSPADPDEFSMSARLGESYTLTPQGRSSDWRLGFNSPGSAPGNTISFSIPLGSEPYLYRDWWIDERARLKKVALADLPATGGDSYAYEGGQLFLKLVSRDLSAEVVDICTHPLCQ